LKQVLGHFGSTRESFWFIPALMSAAAVLLSFVTLSLDDRLDWDGLGSGPFGNAGSAEGARTVLATIAGSMITVASLTFSITIASLSLASTQFGPRLVRNFIRDTGNQIVLGTFIATFAYCVLILRTVKGSETNLFVPSISLTTGVVMAMASLVVLIYFINHIAHSIQASRIIATIGNDLSKAIDRQFPEHLSPQTDKRGSPEEYEEWIAQGESRWIRATRSGYIQRVQYDDLVDLAKEASIVLRMPHHAGQFVAKGADIAEVFGSDQNQFAAADLDSRVLEAFPMDSERAAGDIEFYIDQLVEIAVRALSGAINDPFTAMQCLDQLGASLRQLAERRFPSAHHRDEAGTVRVVASTPTLESALGAAFNLIRQYGSSSPPVMMRLLETLAVLAEYAPSPEHKQALLMHARMVASASAAYLKERVDLDALEDRVSSVIEALEGHHAAAPQP
jgi:uncharacterized membrane protein